jgi:hypothetical protein
MVCFPSFYLLLLGVAFVNATDFEYVNQERERIILTSETIVTTECDIRVGRYSARLDLFYFYRVEYENGSNLDLVGIERALAASIAMFLRDCDKSRKPIYAIELNLPSHEITNSGRFIRTDNKQYDSTLEL